VRLIDLNADVGEGEREMEEVLIPLITSANVACGLHAGDPQTMRTTVALAVRHGAAVGAHPGLDDRAGFGRREMVIRPDTLSDLLVYQLGALDAIARVEGAALAHVKPHGALYNQAAVDASLADVIVGTIRLFDPSLPLMGRAGSAMERAAAAAGHPFIAEAFADRRYRADGSLLPRSEPGAVLTDPEEVARQVQRLITNGEVVASDGSRARVAFESLCVHGDTPGSPTLAARVRSEMATLGVTVAARGRPPRDVFHRS
jgi:5-oxoprolinase (ATP-hydrolysing) subunit A